MRPATTPRKIAGNVGPPRKLPRESDQARPLKSRRSASVDNDTVAADENSPPNALSPENSTAFGDPLVDSAKAIASPPTARPAAIVSTKACLSTTRLDQRASSRTPKIPTAAMPDSAIVQAKSPHPGPPNGGSGNGLSDQAAVLNPEKEPSPMNTSDPT